MTRQRSEFAKWAEYDRVAEWCAKNGIAGNVGDPLPNFTADDVCREIDDDPEAFAEHVRATAYRLAMLTNWRQSTRRECRRSRTASIPTS